MIGRLAERVEFWQDLGVRRRGAALVGVFEGPNTASIAIPKQCWGSALQG